MIGIYKITEKENPNNFYVGKSNDIQRRFKEHQTKTYEQSRIPFDKEIKEKGKDAFTYEILEECKIEQLSEREAYWVEKLKAKESGNKFDGGLRDVVGSHNPNAKLTEEDVINIRKAYNNHYKQKEVYEDYKDKITFQSFQNLWQGRSWAHIMPEVFTEENKQYYKAEQSKGGQGASAKLTLTVLVVKDGNVTNAVVATAKENNTKVETNATNVTADPDVRLDIVKEFGNFCKEKIIFPKLLIFSKDTVSFSYE